MAEHQSAHNPYEDADPITLPPRIPHRQGPAHMTPSSPTSASSHPAQASRGTSLGTPSQMPSPARKRIPAASSAQPRTTASPAAPASQQQPPRTKPSQSYDVQYGMRRRRKMGFGIMAAIIIAAIAVLAGILWWINRPVPVTVNDEAAEVRVGSTLEGIMHEQRVSVEPGNYVSVSGNLLWARQGHAFTATVDNVELTPEEAEAYRIKGGETITFTDGTDITEQYDAVEEPIAPYLVFQGGGYSLQYISQWGYAGTLEHRSGKESGEQADVVTKEPQDCVVTCDDLYIEGDTKYVALTFDDGPTPPYTEEYLDICKRYGIKATFFNLGVNIENFPDLAKRIVDEGHELANHTMDHNQLTAVDADTIFSQIKTSADVIEEATGLRVSHLRPPYGDFTQESWLASRGSVTASIRWTGDSRDWSLPGVDGIIANSLLNLHSGSIILMHDGGGDRSQDLEALPLLIEQLQAEGYQFVTVSDLMAAAGNIPEDICNGSASMPADATWPTQIAPEGYELPTPEESEP